MTAPATPTTLTAWLLGCVADDEATFALKLSEMQQIGAGWAYVPPGASYEPFRLAVCKAVRAVVAEHSPDGDPHEPSCVRCGEETRDDTPDGWMTSRVAMPYPCPTLRALAAVYEDRPGYDAEWAL